MFSISESEPAVFSVKNRRIRPSHLLLAVMLAAYALRLLLIVNGGQFYYPDEWRYRRSLEVADHLYQGRFTDAFNGLLRYYKHHGIAAAKLLPALFHRGIHGLTREGPLLWDKTDYRQFLPLDFRISALIFAMPSVLSIGMIYLIARRAGADEAEALLGAFLLAAANTFFIWSKHLLPYDISMLLGLTVIYFALRLNTARAVNGLWIGSLTFLTFWIYNGHLTLVIVIGLLYAVYLAQNPRQILIRSLAMVSVALLFFIPIAVFNAFAFNVDVIFKLTVFSSQVTHGDFAEGIVFPFLYFRDAEGGIALVWLIGLAFAAWRLWHQPDGRRRGRLWLVCLLTLYLLMSLVSTGLQLFVLYGRTVRALAPFIVMLCAYGLTPWLLRYGRKALSLFIISVSALALTNFIPAIQQQYSYEIVRQVHREYDDLSFETTFSLPSRYHMQMPEVPTARYKLINTGFYYPIAEIADRPEGEVLLEVSHPFNYKPWQYEGMTPAMREIVNRNDVKIWLIDTAE